MANLLPLASYAKEIIPGVPMLAIDEDFPVTVRITMAAIDPNEDLGEDEEDPQPSTLKILKRPMDFPEDGIVLSDDEDSEDDDEEEDEDEDEEMEDASVAKKSKSKSKKDEEEDDEEDDEDDEDEDDEDDFDEDDFDIEEFAVCTLSPKTAFQQPLDIVINAHEQVLFEVTGSYSVYLTGNYVEHPYEDDSDDFDSEEEDSDLDDLDDLDEDDYDLSPDEDELADSGRVEEIEEDEEEEQPKKSKKEQKKDAKKRQAEEAADKGSKKAKTEDKKVAFSKELEQGPTGSTAKKPSTKKLEGGVTVEDKTVGEGPTAKRGDKVGMRYIGKLANGKVFDSNTKGKPFYFTLGKGEVIKGWDVGVAGMALKGERRIVVPAPMAYGKQALPGIPANSELTFDVKLVNIK
uniref:FK506-binding protein n=1 Tax=Blastobotrys adeninivorans TaxID=409370 RepID=A0A060TH27_BLAAD